MNAAVYNSEDGRNLFVHRSHQGSAQRYGLADVTATQVEAHSTVETLGCLVYVVGKFWQHNFLTFYS